MAPRSQLAELQRRDEAGRTGVYLLVGPEMEELIEHILLLAGTLGIHAFKSSRRVSVQEDTDQPERGLPLMYSGRGWEARCVFSDGEFIVLAGSTARLEEANSLIDSSRAKRAALLADGVLSREGDTLRFTQDHLFTSASGAATVVAGGTVNGKRAWKLDDGRTFDEWEQSQFEDSEEADDE